MKPIPPAPIVLVGLRGSGKTTVGRLLADRTQRAFVDLDQALERREQATIPELFARHGEAGFRALEARVIELALPFLSAGSPTGAVIATGGGAVLHPRNRAALSTGRAVYLRIEPARAAARVAADSTTERPALVAGGPEAEARRLLEVREPLYREVAEVEVDADQPPAAVVEAILAALGLAPTPGGPDPASGAPTRPPAP